MQFPEQNHSDLTTIPPCPILSVTDTLICHSRKDSDMRDSGSSLFFGAFVLITVEALLIVLALGLL